MMSEPKIFQPFFKALFLYLLSLAATAVLSLLLAISALLYWQDSLKEIAQKRIEKEIEGNGLNGYQIYVGTFSFQYPFYFQLDSLVIDKGQRSFLQVKNISFAFDLKKLVQDSLSLSLNIEEVMCRNVGSLLGQKMQKKIFIEEPKQLKEEVKPLFQGLNQLSSFLLKFPLDIAIDQIKIAKCTLEEKETILTTAISGSLFYLEDEQQITSDLLLSPIVSEDISKDKTCALSFKAVYNEPYLSLKLQAKDELHLCKEVIQAPFDLSHLKLELAYDFERARATYLSRLGARLETFLSQRLIPVEMPLATLDLDLKGRCQLTDREEDSEDFQASGRLKVASDFALQVETASLGLESASFALELKTDAQSQVSDSLFEGIWRQDSPLLKRLAFLKVKAPLNLSGTVSGSLFQPQFKVSCQLAEGEIFDQPVEGAMLLAEAHLATDKIVGTAQVEMEKAFSLPVSAYTPFEFNFKERELYLPDLFMQSVSFLGYGELTYSPLKGALGTLSFHSADLSPLRPYVEQNMSGELLAAIEIGQGKAQGNLHLEQVSYGPCHLEKGDFKFSVDDAGHFSYELKGEEGALIDESYPLLYADELQFSLISTDKGRCAFTASFREERGKGALDTALDIIDCAFNGEICSLDNSEAIELQLKELCGRFGDETLFLVSPFKAYYSSEKLIIDPFALRTQKGGATVQLALEKERLSFQLKTAHFPCKLISFLNLPLFDGLLSGELKVDGVDGNLNGLMAAELKEGQVPLFESGHRYLVPLKLKLSSKLKQGRLSFFLDLEADKLKSHLRGETECELKESFNGYWQPFQLPLAIQAIAPLKGFLQVKGDTSPYVEALIAHTKVQDAQVEGQFNVGGTLGAPELFGSLHLKKGSFESLETGIAIDELDAEITAEGKALTLTRCVGKSGKEGSVLGQGFLSFQDFNDIHYQVDVKLAKVPLLELPATLAIGDGQLLFKGTLKKAKLLGDLTIRRTDILILPPPPNFESIDVLYLRPEKKKHRYQPTAAKSFPIECDLQLQIAKDAFVEGRGLVSEWQGDIHITGTVKEPHLKGQLNIRRGEFSIGGRPFKIEEGSIVLGDHLKSSIIHVRASLQADAVFITAEIRGPINNPQVILQSRPPMSEKDILSWVLFNKSAGQISPFEALKIANIAWQLNGGQDGLEIFRKVRKGLGLDRLDISGQGDENGGNISLHAGKYIFNGIFVSVNKVINAELNTFSLEVELKKHIKLQAEISGESEESRLLLQWQKRY